MVKPDNPITLLPKKDIIDLSLTNNATLNSKISQTRISKCFSDSTIETVFKSLKFETMISNFSAIFHLSSAGFAIRA